MISHNSKWVLPQHTWHCYFFGNTFSKLWLNFNKEHTGQPFMCNVDFYTTRTFTWRYMSSYSTALANYLDQVQDFLSLSLLRGILTWRFWASSQRTCGHNLSTGKFRPAGTPITCCDVVVSVLARPCSPNQSQHGHLSEEQEPICHVLSAFKAVWHPRSNS